VEVEAEVPLRARQWRWEHDPSSRGRRLEEDVVLLSDSSESDGERVIGCFVAHASNDACWHSLNASPSTSLSPSSSLTLSISIQLSSSCYEHDLGNGIHYSRNTIGVFPGHQVSG
jgi:hypothetical protein